MFRVDTSTATDSLPAPGPAGTPGYFQSGNPQAGHPATIPGADWFNMVQEELASFVEHYGLTLDKTDRTQVRLAIEAAIAASLSPSVPAGSILASGSQATADGYLLCNGAAISRTAYADLFTAIGGAFGAGDGSTTFNIPDLRGEFLRGWDHGRGVDPGRAMGSRQDDMFKSHAHNVPTYTQINTSGPAVASNSTANGPWGATSSHGTGGVETRPRNIAIIFYIKY